MPIAPKLDNLDKPSMIPKTEQPEQSARICKTCDGRDKGRLVGVLGKVHVQVSPPPRLFCPSSVWIRSPMRELPHLLVHFRSSILEHGELGS